ncbi:MAG: 2Fe-2S iron-sulfur cluster binding domain-containing protein [Holosporales bacterium]|jgi:ferredoxin|nr:2Fe-2S iron-sulfur cluster binding domain-containing protein [Holosporales bacterium]
MVAIKFKSKAGEVLAHANVGETLLMVAQKSGVDLFGGCDGAGVCGTCHILVDHDFLEKLGEPSIEENDLLEVIPSRAPNSRIACQVTVSEGMDGLTVTIP